MHDITIPNLSTSQLLQMADALYLSGSTDLARNLCLSALKRERNALSRYQLRLRLGIMARATPQNRESLERLQGLEADYVPAFVGAGLATWLKTVPFLDDERFMALEEKHQALLPIANWHWNLHTVTWAVQQTRDVEGDLVELGVFKGHTTLFTAEYVGFQDWPKRWVLFDTFDGIPDDQIDPGWEDANQGAYKGTYSYGEVVDRFAGFPNIEVVQGRVPEILDGRSPERISFLHIDLNNTKAEIAALDILVQRLAPGAVMILDDYCWSPARSQFLAEREWFAARGLHVLGLPTGQGVFIKR